MRFWDASALVPLLFEERDSARLQALRREDPKIVVWWATDVECASALARREREGRLTPDFAAAASDRLAALRKEWDEISPSALLRETALRLVRLHPLRAADALQLAAASIAADRRPPTLAFVTLDARLAAAARREGFARVLPA